MNKQELLEGLKESSRVIFEEKDRTLVYSAYPTYSKIIDYSITEIPDKLEFYATVITWMRATIKDQIK